MQNYFYWSIFFAVFPDEMFYCFTKIVKIVGYLYP